MKKKQFDVTALGELLIDFTENGKSAQGNMTYEANPGGAPCNVLSMLSMPGRCTLQRTCHAGASWQKNSFHRQSR